MALLLSDDFHLGSRCAHLLAAAALAAFLRRLALLSLLLFLGLVTVSALCSFLVVV